MGGDVFRYRPTFAPNKEALGGAETFSLDILNLYSRVDCCGEQGDLRCRRHQHSIAPGASILQCCFVKH